MFKELTTQEQFDDFLQLVAINVEDIRSKVCDQFVPFDPADYEYVNTVCELARHYITLESMTVEDALQKSMEEYKSSITNAFNTNGSVNVNTNGGFH